MASIGDLSGAVGIGNSSVWSPEAMFDHHREHHNYKSTFREEDYTTELNTQVSNLRLLLE